MQVLEKKTLAQDLDSAATKEYEAILEKNKIALKRNEDLLIKLEKVTEKYISLKVIIHGKCNIFLGQRLKLCTVLKLISKSRLDDSKRMKYA